MNKWNSGPSDGFENNFAQYLLLLFLNILKTL